MELPELRRQFEEWYEADAMPAEADWFKRYEDGEYYHSHTHDAWKAWQEAVKREREECAYLCDQLFKRAGDADECADAIRARSEQGKEER